MNILPWVLADIYTIGYRKSTNYCCLLTTSFYHFVHKHIYIYIYTHTKLQYAFVQSNFVALASHTMTPAPLLDFKYIPCLSSPVFSPLLLSCKLSCLNNESKILFIRFLFSFEYRNNTWLKCASLNAFYKNQLCSCRVILILQISPTGSWQKLNLMYIWWSKKFPAFWI